MKKTCYRYFAGFITAQQNWLNRMAEKGWRLIKTGKMSYEFGPCTPGEVEYRVEFVGQMSWGKSKDYAAFLKGLGYEVFYKNINLNWSVGKVSWRPYGEKLGQVATTPGSYNHELLIVAKKRDGQPFELHTTYADRVYYWKVMRNACLSAGLLLGAMAGWLFYARRLQWPGALALGALAAGSLLFAAIHQCRAMRCQKEGKVQEQ